MAAHAPGFLKLIEDARTRVRTLSIEELVARRERGERFLLVDVREDREWAAGHLPGARHIGKGIVERDIEREVPDPKTHVIFYCGGGFRSVLVCDVLQRMGYTNVESLDGGWRGWNALGLPVEHSGPA